MAYGSASRIPPAVPSMLARTPLNRQQIVGFWAAWFGWMLDGMDSVIYSLVLGPALTELLPRSGMQASPANIGFVGSIMFALFLMGWGMSFIWGPISDKFGRTKSLAATVFVYAVFTGAAALSTNMWELALFRFLAGVGIGGQWAMAGTYVAEAWPEDRRKMGAGYLQTGYYFGFFVAAALNYTIGATFGWRAMFVSAAGMDLPSAVKMASYGTGLLSIGTILGCIAAPWLAERVGRPLTLALYYLGMMVTIAAAFGWAFYLPTGTALQTFMTILFFMGLFGGNFRDLQPVAARTVRHRGARHRLRLLHLGRPLHRGWCQLRARRRHRSDGHARDTDCAHRDRFRRRAVGHPVHDRDPRRALATLDGRVRDARQQSIRVRRKPPVTTNLDL
jgi:MFS family permease